MLHSLLNEALALLSAAEWVCSVHHVYREANFCANLLARLGHTGGFQWTLFYVVPPPLSMALHADMFGVVTNRVVR